MYNQYLVNEPLLSMTAAHLRLQERIRELIFFYLLRTFCPHLGSFFFFFNVVSSFTTFWPNFTSGLLQVIYRDLG